MPTLRLRRAMEQAPAGASVRLLADDPMAKIDVPHFAAEKGYALIESGSEGAWLFFVLGKPASAV